jgi:Domain of unknown function (DUF5666)
MIAHKFTPVALVALAAGLAACGGGGGDGTDRTIGDTGAATPISVVGRIDGFGSVFVNGIEFETSGAHYRIDDRDGFRDSDLSVGMIVRIKGMQSSDGHGRADEIDYDDDVEGIVANLAIDPSDDTIKRFTVFGTPVVASSVDTVFKGVGDVPYSFDDLADGDHVEVSGDFDGDALVASFIEQQDAADDTFEIKGVVSGFDGASFSLTLRNGIVLAITLATDAVIPDAGIADDQFVEVEGTIPDPVGAPDALLATRVELEHRHDFGDDHRDQDGRVCVEGVLTLDGETWSVRDMPLVLDADTQYEPESLAAMIVDGTAAGLRVKIRGTLVDGAVQVTTISAESREDVEVEGIFDSAVTDDATGITSVTVVFPPVDGSVTVLVGAETLLKDDDGEAGFDFANLEPGVSFVEIHGHTNLDGPIEAAVLKQRDGEKYEIEGALDTDGFDEGVSISVLGLVFALDADTRMPTLPVAGDFVRVEDTDLDGTADRVDVIDLDKRHGHRHH